MFGNDLLLSPCGARGFSLRAALVTGAGRVALLAWTRAGCTDLSWEVGCPSAACKRANILYSDLSEETC